MLYDIKQIDKTNQYRCSPLSWNMNYWDVSKIIFHVGWTPPVCRLRSRGRRHPLWLLFLDNMIYQWDLSPKEATHQWLKPGQVIGSFSCGSSQSISISCQIRRKSWIETIGNKKIKDANACQIVHICQNRCF